MAEAQEGASPREGGAASGLICPPAGPGGLESAAGARCPVQGPTAGTLDLWKLGVGAARPPAQGAPLLRRETRPAGV